MPAEDAALASWLPVLPGMTPHRLRHSHHAVVPGNEALWLGRELNDLR